MICEARDLLHSAMMQLALIKSPYAVGRRFELAFSGSITLLAPLLQIE